MRLAIRGGLDSGTGEKVTPSQNKKTIDAKPFSSTKEPDGLVQSSTKP